MMPSDSAAAFGMPARSYGSGDVCRITGATAKQLQWWDNHDLVSCTRKDHRRFFSALEVLEVQVISQLKRKGFSLHRVRRVLRSFRGHLARLARESWNGVPDLYLLTDGKSAQVEERPEPALAAAIAARHPVAVTHLSELMKEISEYRPPGRQSPDQLELF
jgi:DNA-binding transcriptional MerR regulator